MSNHTHKVAVRAIYTELDKDRQDRTNHFEIIVAKLREMKLRKAMGQERIYTDRQERTIDKTIADLAGTLKYAQNNLRVARRKLWQFNALQRQMRHRVEYDI